MIFYSSHYHYLNQNNIIYMYKSSQYHVLHKLAKHCVLNNQRHNLGNLNFDRDYMLNNMNYHYHFLP